MPSMAVPASPNLPSLFLLHQVVWSLQDPRPQVGEARGQTGREGADGQSGH